MRYHEINEARRNPEQNPKISILDVLSRYKDRDDVFISFTEDVGQQSHNNGRNTSGAKLGIKPRSHFSTPLGIYAYPLKQSWTEYVQPKIGKERGLFDQTLKTFFPFASERPNAYLFEIDPSANIITADYAKSDFLKDAEKLKKYVADKYQKESDVIEYYIRHRVSENTSTASALWKMVEAVAYQIVEGGNRRPMLVKNEIFRALGYDGAIDHKGIGFIHVNEPIQAVFFSIKPIKVIALLDNKLHDKMPDEDVARYKFNAMIQRKMQKSLVPTLAAMDDNQFHYRFDQDPDEHYDEIIRAMLNLWGPDDIPAQKKRDLLNIHLNKHETMIRAMWNDRWDKIKSS
jgi:hypothetical protein